MKRRRWLQFSMRLLLAIPLIAGGFIVWWQRPFTIEAQSFLREKVEVRRGWDGRLYYWGTATQFYENGQKAAQRQVYGPEFGKHCENQIGVPGTRYWHEDGRELTDSEWFLYYVWDYNRRRTGHPAKTEAEWRELLEQARPYFARRKFSLPL